MTSAARLSAEEIEEQRAPFEAWFPSESCHLLAREALADRD